MSNTSTQVSAPSFTALPKHKTKFSASLQIYAYPSYFMIHAPGFWSILIVSTRSSLNHTSRSYYVYQYPMEFDVSARFARQATLLNLSTYKSLATIMTYPLSDGPNSFPTTIHSCSLHFVLRYALPVFQSQLSSSFNDAIIKSILKLYLDTTLKYVILDG